MRCLFITAIAVFMNLFASCQTTDNGEAVMKKLSESYNKSDYKGLYDMLSPEFKTQAQESEITGFYQSSLKPLGNIASWNRIDKKGDGLTYTVVFEKGKLDLDLYLNSKNEIAGMQWLPSKNKEAVKKRNVSTIKSNNPKQTKLQLLVDSLALAHLESSINCGISIGIIDGDKTEMYFYGGYNKENNKLQDANTLYEIGSITKTFTGILIAHAINEGKIKADDDIRKYLHGDYPNLHYKGSPIKVVHLANHTSTLPRLPDNLDKQPNYDAQDPYKNYSKQMMYDYLKTIKPDTFPGIVSEYSNLGVAILGIILEKVYQQPLESLVISRIAAPLKMSNTKFMLTENDKTKMATGYMDADGSIAHNWELKAFNAAGGLKSSMNDMVNYIRANMNEVNADIKLSHQLTFKGPNMDAGLNWMLQTTKDKQTLVWHDGSTYGFSSFIGYIKERNAGVVVLNNSGVNVDAIAISILKELKK